MIINGRVHNASTYTNQGCRCDICRASWRERLAARKAQRYAWVRANGLPDTVAHSASAYGNWGCRCDICTAAHSAASRDRIRRNGRTPRNGPKIQADRAARKRATAMYGLPDGVEHGTTAAYGYWGCRCADFRRVTAREKRAARAAKMANA